MNLYEFNLLDLNERCQLVLNEGTYLSSRIIPGLRIQLYRIGNFYSEVWYDGFTNELKKVTSFQSRKALEPYIEMVRINL